MKKKIFVSESSSEDTASICKGLLQKAKGSSIAEQGSKGCT